MISIKEFMEAVGHRVTGGSEYGWPCYGPNVRYLDSESSDYTASVVFDTLTQLVYEMEVWDYKRDRTYRWVHPEFLKKLKKECKKREVKFSIAIDDRKYIDLDVEADILEKATAIANGEEYDDRVIIELDLNAEEMALLAHAAHTKDITINQFIAEVLEEVINEGKDA